MKNLFKFLLALSIPISTFAPKEKVNPWKDMFPKIFDNTLTKDQKEKLNQRKKEWNVLNEEWENIESEWHTLNQNNNQQNDSNANNINEKRFDIEGKRQTLEKKLRKNCMHWGDVLKQSKKIYQDQECYVIYWDNLKKRINYTQGIEVNDIFYDNNDNDKKNEIKTNLANLEAQEKKLNNWKTAIKNMVSNAKETEQNNMTETKKQLDILMGYYEERYLGVLKGNQIIKHVNYLTVNFPNTVEKGYKLQKSKTNDTVVIPDVPVFESIDDEYYSEDKYLYAEEIQKMRADYTVSLRSTQKINMSDEQFRSYEFHVNNNYLEDKFDCSIIMEQTEKQKNKEEKEQKKLNKKQEQQNKDKTAGKEVGAWNKIDNQNLLDEIFIDYTQNKLVFTKCQLTQDSKTNKNEPDVPIISMHMFLNYDAEEPAPKEITREEYQNIMSDQAANLRQKNAIYYFFNEIQSSTENTDEQFKKILSILRADYPVAKSTFTSNKKTNQRKH